MFASKWTQKPNFDRMKVDELKDYLRKCKAKVSGNMPELLETSLPHVIIIFFSILRCYHGNILIFKKKRCFAPFFNVFILWRFEHNAMFLLSWRIRALRSSKIFNSISQYESAILRCLSLFNVLMDSSSNEEQSCSATSL